MMTCRLTIYDADAQTVRRATEHTTRSSAIRSLRDYERRTGRRYAHSIDETRQPERNDAEGWDRYRLRHGIATR